MNRIKHSPKGAFISTNDLRVYAAALTCAIELCRMDIDSHTRPNPKFHDAKYLQWLKATKQSLKDYQRQLVKLNKFLNSVGAA